MTKQLVKSNRTAIEKIDLIDEWIKYLIQNEQILEGGKSEKSYRRILGKFYQFLHDNKINEPDLNSITLWTENLKQRPKYIGTKREKEISIKPSSINSYLVPVRAFFRFLDECGPYKERTGEVMASEKAKIKYYRNDIHTKNLVKNKRTKNAKRHLREWLRPEWLKQIVESIDDNTLTGARDKAMILSMYYSGLRAVECAGLTHSDIIKNGLTWSLNIKGKGRSEKEIVPTDKTAIDAIGKYQKLLSKEIDLKDDSPLFICLSWTDGKQYFGKRLRTESISRIWRSHIDRLDLPKKYSKNLCAHSARHGLGTYLWLTGMAAPAIQRIMRHNSIDTTYGYLHDINDEKAFEDYQKYMNPLNNLLEGKNDQWQVQAV